MRGPTVDRTQQVRLRLVRRLAAALIGLTIATMTAGCGEDDRGNGNGTTPGPTVNLAQYAQGVQQAQQELDLGALSYTAMKTLSPNAEVEFEVAVTDMGKRSTRPTTPPGGTVGAPGDVPTGSDLTVTLDCSQPLTCKPQDSSRKTIVGQGNAGVWSFSVHADQVGDAHLHLAVETYLGDSDTVLSTVPVDLDVTVRRTLPYTLSQGLHWLFSTLPGLGLFSGGALATAAGGLRRWLHLRQRSDADRVLAAIPRRAIRDQLLFRLIHDTGRPVREVVALRPADVRLSGGASGGGRMAAAVLLPGPGGRREPVEITDRRSARLLHQQVASCAGRQGLLLSGEVQLSVPEVEELWRWYCGRIGLDLPLRDLGRRSLSGGSGTTRAPGG